MATTAQYAAQPVIESFSVVTTTTDTGRSTPLNSTELCSGPSESAGVGVGKRITKVTVIETGNAAGSSGTANVIRFWIEPPVDIAGTNTTKYLLCEKAVTAVNPSSTAIGFRTEVPELVGLILPGSGIDGAAKLHMSAHSASTFHVTIESGLL